MQIHILGNVCSGKTYIVKKISRKFKLKNFSLDEIVFKRDHSKRTDTEISSSIEALIKNKNRISEGGFIKEAWAIRILKNTEKVYVLRVNLFIQLWRVIKRNYEFRISKNPETWVHFLKMIKYVFKNKSIYKEYELHLQKIGVKYKKVKSLEEIVSLNTYFLPKMK